MFSPVDRESTKPHFEWIGLDSVWKKCKITLSSWPDSSLRGVLVGLGSWIRYGYSEAVFIINRVKIILQLEFGGGTYSFVLVLRENKGGEVPSSNALDPSAATLHVKRNWWWEPRRGNPLMFGSHEDHASINRKVSRATEVPDISSTCVPLIAAPKRADLKRVKEII